MRTPRNTCSLFLTLSVDILANKDRQGIRSYPRRLLNSATNVASQFYKPYSQLSTYIYFRTLRATSGVIFSDTWAGQLSDYLRTATTLNLSHSNLLPSPAVTLICPVEVCPMRRVCYPSSGNLAVRVPPVSVSRRTLFSCIQASSGISCEVGASAARHIKPALPSHR